MSGRIHEGDFYEDDEPVEVMEQRFRDSPYRGVTSRPPEWKVLYLNGYGPENRFEVCPMCSALVQSRSQHEEHHRVVRDGGI